MPYIQSERSILYSLHRGARSKGLQAGRERELVPGLCVEQCGLMEMFISGSRTMGSARIIECCTLLAWVWVSLRESLRLSVYLRS